MTPRRWEWPWAPTTKKLAVAVPNQRNSVGLGNPNKRGDVLVLDIDSLDMTTGKIGNPIKAQPSALAGLFHAWR
ncbi:MAG: hypothetical protein H7224_05545 [Polaromonas sp.]|nr:hypothetical protein [Polaromonas sp.]